MQFNFVKKISFYGFLMISILNGYALKADLIYKENQCHSSAERFLLGRVIILCDEAFRNHATICEDIFIYS